MIKLALLGKNINHSLSPTLYKKLLGNKKFTYQLLDYKNEMDIPSLVDIFDKYQLTGLNITSPYKKHFLQDLRDQNNNWPVNIIKKDGDSFFGANTDELAIEEILKKYQQIYDYPFVILLGDGAMAQITILLLKNYHFDFVQYSRKKTKDFEFLDISSIAQKKQKNILVINACARDYFFQGCLETGSLESKIIFWDYNYNNIKQSEIVGKNEAIYIDGIELLERQAIHALNFLNIYK